MIATIEIERIVKIIEKSESKDVLKEIYEWLKENDLMKHVPRKFWWKLMVSGGDTELLTSDDEKAIEESLDDDNLIPQKEIEKSIKYDPMDKSSKEESGISSTRCANSHTKSTQETQGRSSPRRVPVIFKSSLHLQQLGRGRKSSQTNIHLVS